MKTRYILLLVIVLFNLLPMISKAENATNAASFLDIGMGARAVSLGGAFVSVADDATAGYWNPAGLAQLSGPAVSIADRVSAMDVNYASLAIALPLPVIGFLGLSTIYYGCSNVNMYDENGLSAGNLSDMETAIILSYAYRLNQLCMGANFKYIYQDMNANDDYISSASSGMGSDVSILYKLHESLSVGAIFHGRYNIDSENSKISNISPLNIRAGVHYKAKMNKDNSLGFMLDFDQTKSYPLKLHFGTELALYDILSFRAGLDDLYTESREAKIEYLDLLKYNAKPTFGLGIKWNIGKDSDPIIEKQNAIIFDYAISIDKIGITHLFSIAYQF